MKGIERSRKSAALSAMGVIAVRLWRHITRIIDGGLIGGARRIDDILLAAAQRLLL